MNWNLAHNLPQGKRFFPAFTPSRDQETKA